MTACTVVTVWNNEKLFLEFERQLHKQENVDCTLLAIDNRNGKFSGIREAFNACAGQINTEFVLFAHQDVLFVNRDSLHKFLRQLDALGDFGIVGVAGCPTGTQWKVLSTILHGDNKRSVGEPITEPQQIQTVDECLFAMRTETFSQMLFTEVKGWHLYAVEQCIRAQRAGLKNYVIPCELYHLSDGKSLDPSYTITLKAMGKAYDLGILNTTVKQWNLDTWSGRLYIEYYCYKQKLKRFLMKKGLLKG